MKKVIGCIVGILLMFPVAVHCQPYLVCAPQAGVDAYKIKWSMTAPEEIVPAEADRSLRYDLAPLPPGDYPSAEVCAGDEYFLDGQPTGIYNWSTPRPFALEKPVTPGVPVSLGLEAPL